MPRDTPSTAADRRRLAAALPALRDADARAIGRFVDAAWAEHGLARQTQHAYRRDLELLARWRDGAGGGLTGADRAALWMLVAVPFTVGYTFLGHHSARENIAPFSALQWLLWLACWLVTGLYATRSWRRGGQTLGMRPWRLRLVAVTEDLEPNELVDVTGSQ